MPRLSVILSLVVLVLCVSSTVHAQATEFITKAEIDQRKKELDALADKLLTTTDTHERVKIRDEMLKLDSLKGQNGFAIPPFTRVYQECQRVNDVNACMQAAVGISSIDHPGMVEVARTLLEDPNVAVRLRVLKGIHDNKITRAWTLLPSQLNHPNVEVAGWAARTLGKLGEGAQGGATGPLIDLLVRSWNELQSTPFSDTERRQQLNTLVETVGMALAELTKLTWSVAPETKDLADSVAAFTNWWNQKHLPSLQDPRIGERRSALDAIDVSADRSTVGPLIEFMAREQVLWEQVRERLAKQDSLVLLVKANDVLRRISGQNVELSTTADSARITEVIKTWTAWWADQIK